MLSSLFKLAGVKGVGNIIEKDIFYLPCQMRISTQLHYKCFQREEIYNSVKCTFGNENETSVVDM